MGLIKVFDRGVAVGDILYVDSSANPKKMFARPSEVGFLPTSGTYTQTVKGVSTTYTAPFTSVGVVFHVDGRKVYVINKASGGDLQYKTEQTSDGTEINWCLKKNGAKTQYRGVLSVTTAASYWATNGFTPTTVQEPLDLSKDNYEATGRTSSNMDCPVTRTAFETSEYCLLLRQTYASYESYISENCGVKFPQEVGCFSMPDAKTITYAYNDAKHPAFQYCAGVKCEVNNVEVDGLAAGDWYLPGVYEGTALMRDATRIKVNASVNLISGAQISNTVRRWFAQRYSAKSAWLFHGSNGTLYYSNCTDARRVQAVALLTA